MENREFIIVTDSTADMDTHYYEVNNIEVIGLHYIIDKQSYTQCTKRDLDTKSFYDRVRRGSMPKTNPLSYEDVAGALEKIAIAGKDVFFLCFSSGLSASYQNAMIAAEDIMAKYPDCTIKVVDSLCACGGEGLLLHLCVKKLKTGVTLDELVSYAERMKQYIVHLITVDDLNHLHRGGRLSKASAIVGSIFSVKPLICVDSTGRLASYAKVNGRKKSLETLAQHMKEKYLPGENEEVFILDSDCPEDAEALGSMILRLMPDVKRIRYGKIGAVIGAHTGADTVALFFVGKNRNPVEK